jgi:hypothetical protein
MSIEIGIALHKPAIVAASGGVAGGQNPSEIGLAQTEAWFYEGGLPAAGTTISTGANKWANSSTYTVEYDDWVEAQGGQGPLCSGAVLDGHKGAVFSGVLTRLVNSQGDPRNTGRTTELWVLCKWDALDGGTVVNNWHTGSIDRLQQDASSNLIITRNNAQTTVKASHGTGWHLLRWTEVETGGWDTINFWVDGVKTYGPTTLSGRSMNYWAAGDNFAAQDFNGKLVEMVLLQGTTYTVAQANSLLTYYSTEYPSLSLPTSHS